MSNIPPLDFTLRPRSRRAFTDDDMRHMAALYYDPGVPLPRVAKAFGVPASTLLRWVAEMEWPRRSARGRASEPGARGEVDRSVEPSSPDAAVVAPGRPPSMLGTWRRVAFVARREIDAAMNLPPRTLGERERLARLIASLTRSLGRVRVEIDGEKERIEGLRIRREVEAKMTAMYGPRR